MEADGSPCRALTPDDIEKTAAWWRTCSIRDWTNKGVVARVPPRADVGPRAQRRCPMNNKIQSQHLALPAYVYLRQSTPPQLLHHQESTQRQYGLQDKARALGWPPHLIRVLDGDPGQSGSSPDAPREDFKQLVADVSMGKVGAIFALEASRLSRCCADWHRLLELSAMSGALIIDEDGCYDPSDFNDQLLLGIKGTMSQVELHFMRVRLLGGRLNKARTEELRMPLAAGFLHDEAARIALDPDQQVQHIVRQLFDSFRKTGSAYGVAHDFADKGLLMPKRLHGGAGPVVAGLQVGCP